MSNRSRARYRHAEEEVAPDPDQVATAEAVSAAYGAIESGDKKGGLAKLVDVVLRDREKALASKDELAEPLILPGRPKLGVVPDPDPIGLREPSAYEAAVLFALGNRMVVRPTMGPPIHAPIHLFSPIYGGTVEPERVQARRKKNRAARLARKGRRPVHHGGVYQSRFGYPVRVPGISRGVDIDGAIDAEVVDA